jgi:hypothetical protein
MTNEPKRPMPLDYREPDPRVERQWRRILLCIGLPIIGFGVSSFGNDALVRGAITAVGAFLVALVLPVRE